MVTIIDKLKKIQALAERGIGGEKDTAQRMLDELLKKYDLTIDQLTSEEKERCYFNYRTAEERLVLLQCLGFVCDDGTSQVSFYTLRAKKRLAFNLTETQRVHLTELYKFHKENIRKEFKEFKKAFSAAYMNKHAITVKASASSPCNDPINMRIFSSIYNGLSDISFTRLLSK
jgi:hypothetical protein